MAVHLASAPAIILTPLLTSRPDQMHGIIAMSLLNKYATPSLSLTLDLLYYQHPTRQKHVKPEPGQSLLFILASD